MHTPNHGLTACPSIAAVVGAQVGPCSDLRLRVLNDLLDQVLFEPCYDTLRTKQQLGYTVHSGTRLTYGTLGYAVVVVSAAYGAQEVEERIEAFLQQQEAVLQVGAWPSHGCLQLELWGSGMAHGWCVLCVLEGANCAPLHQAEGNACCLWLL